MPRKRRDPGGYGGGHASRTDLTQPTRVASGQQYGQRQAQEAAQRAVPLPRQATPALPPPGTPAAAAAARAAGGGVDPHQAAIEAATASPFRPVNIAAPSSRPDEPVTAGLGGLAAPSPIDEMRAIYARFPSESLREMIEEAES